MVSSIWFYVPFFNELYKISEIAHSKPPLLKRFARVLQYILRLKFLLFELSGL